MSLRLAAAIRARAWSLQGSALPWSVGGVLALVVAVLYLFWIGGCTMGAYEWTWDDNYMTYIYSRNLAQGHGLRFNAVDTEPTEGFSSLAHVVLVALTDKLGADPLVASRAIGLAVFLLIPLIVGWPLSRFLGVPSLGVLTIAYGAQILYFLSIAVVYHLVLGMETMIFMGSLACLAGWTLGEFTPAPASASPRSVAGRVLVGFLVLAFAIASRPEGPFLAILTLALICLARQFLLPELKARNDRGFFLVVVVTAAGLLAYFAWKWFYFGYLIPNPYYVKTHSGVFGNRGVFFQGWEHTRAFGWYILPWLAVGAPLYALVRGDRRAKRALLIAALPGAVVVLAYARAIHEAAFFHRYEFPFLVYLYLPLVGILAILASRFRVLPLLLVPVAILGVHLSSVAREIKDRDPLTWLGKNLDLMEDTWAGIGKDLAQTGLGQKVTIAVGASGAIPYFSGFRAIDLAGLNNNYLSGRTPRTVEEIWSYIESFKPDVFQSGLPPASPGVGVDQYDPVYVRFYAARMRDGIVGSEFEKFWDGKRVRRMQRFEMVYLRDHYILGAAYLTGDKSWMLLYVRKNSPYRWQLLLPLRTSSRADKNSDLGDVYGTDLRAR